MKTLEEFKDDLRWSNPDYVVDVLNIQSSTLVDLFEDDVIALYKEEWGTGEDNE